MERKDSRGRILRKGEYERKNGYAFRQSDQATGEVSWCYAKTLNELRKRERQLVEDSVSGVKRVGRKKTIDSLFRIYQAERRVDVATGAIRESTLDKQIYDWKNHVAPRLGRRKVASVTTQDLERMLLDMMATDGLKLSSVETIYNNAVRGFFKWCHRNGYIKSDPSIGALSDKARKIKAQLAASDTDEVPRCLDEQQRRYLLKALESDRYEYHAPIIRLLLHTGLRFGELAGLGEEHIKDDMLLIRRTLRYATDEDGHSRYVMNGPKTPSSKRDVWLTDTAREDLANWRSLGIHCEDTVAGHTGLVFCSPKGHALNIKNFTSVLKRLAAESNGVLPMGFSSHWLRHTFICDAIDAGVPAAVVASFVGHSSLDVTLKVYYSCRREAKAAGLAILNNSQLSNMDASHQY